MTNIAYDQIAAEFHARINAISHGVDVMATGLRETAELAMKTALADQRVLVCATRADEGIALHMAQSLRRPDEGFPPLPALLVVGDDSRAQSSHLWQDLRALSRDGDLLLCLDSDPSGALSQPAEAFAKERRLRFAALSSKATTNSRFWIPVGAETVALRHELLLMAGHTLLSQIRKQLMGT